MYWSTSAYLDEIMSITNNFAGSKLVSVSARLLPQRLIEALRGMGCKPIYFKF